MLIQTRLPGTQRLDALPHFAGGLVGEGDGQDVATARTPCSQQPGDAAGDDARLAAAGPGEDEQRTLEMGDGFGLGGSEIGEQGGHRCLRKGRVSLWIGL